MASFAGISVLLHHLRRKQTPLKYAAFLRGNTVIKLDAVRYFSIDTKIQSENIKNEWYLSAAVCVERIFNIPSIILHKQSLKHNSEKINCYICGTRSAFATT